MTKTPKVVMAKRLLTLNEAAEYLAIGVWKLRRMIWNGEIPFVQHGKGARVLLDVNDLDKHIEATKEKH